MAPHRKPKPTRARRGREPGSGDQRLRDHGRFVAAVYEVQVDSGELTDFEPLVMNAPPRWSRRCYETLFNAAAPCDGCPALAPRRASSQKSELTVLHGAGYRVALADPLGDGRFRMHLLQLTDSVVSGLARARLDRRTQKAKLSTREQSVLELLLLARSSADIARALGITERTVRFHVANVLTKLEADSRADLLRLLL